MSFSRLLLASPALVMLVAVVGVWWMLRRERRNPTSYTRRPDVLADWDALSTAEQEAVDEAALDVGEQAEIDARCDAGEAARFLADQVRINVLYRP
ncbi:MAG: hypothetical protein HOY75_08380 [Streptomyces sp.]|nr:hypothetical protein [Streptomyces sp.]